MSEDELIEYYNKEFYSNATPTELIIAYYEQLKGKCFYCNCILHKTKETFASALKIDTLACVKCGFEITIDYYTDLVCSLSIIVDNKLVAVDYNIISKNTLNEIFKDNKHSIIKLLKCINRYCESVIFQ